MNPHSSPNQAQRRQTDKRAAPRQDTAGRGAGLPARDAQTERTATGDPLSAKEASAKSNLRLPHERDEDASMTNPAVQPRIHQAAKDLERGLKDTSRSTETDQTYHRLREGMAASPGRPPKDKK